KLPIEHDSDLAVFVPHRLVARGKVDNCKASMAEKDTRQLVDMEAVTIGPAMCQCGRHALKIGTVAVAHESGKPTHLIWSFGRIPRVRAQSSVHLKKR